MTKGVVLHDILSNGYYGLLLLSEINGNYSMDK